VYNPGAVSLIACKHTSLFYNDVSLCCLEIIDGRFNFFLFSFDFFTLSDTVVIRFLSMATVLCLAAAMTSESTGFNAVKAG
jgi:hypothetical protein